MPSIGFGETINFSGKSIFIAFLRYDFFLKSRDFQKVLEKRFCFVKMKSFPHKIKLKRCIFKHTFSHTSGLVQCCREVFFQCWTSKTNKITLFCTKLTFADVKGNFPLFHLLLTLRMDFHCLQKYVKHLHTLGVKTRPFVGIYLIFLVANKRLNKRSCPSVGR